MRVCIPYRTGIGGGPVSFCTRLSVALRRRGVEVTTRLADVPYDVVLVINATSQLHMLARARLRRTRIVQRVGAPNWIPAGLSVRDRLKANVRTRMVAFTREYVADHVVYQSEFARSRWLYAFGSSNASESVVYNGVDLVQFRPPPRRADRHDPTIRILAAEGSFNGPYSTGIDVAILVCENLIRRGLQVHLSVVGLLNERELQRLRRWAYVTFRPAVPLEMMPAVYAEADCYLSLDRNPACPNTVVEALACGTPVVGFATGAIPELLANGGGMAVPYPGNPWSPALPRVDELAEAVRVVHSRFGEFSRAARRAAEERFAIGDVCDSYLTVLQDSGRVR